MKLIHLKASLYIFCLAFCFLYLFGCSDKSITEGVVFKKEYRKASTGYRSEKRIKTRVRRNNTINIETTVSFKVAYPDRWVLFVHSKEGEDTTDFYVHKKCTIVFRLAHILSSIP